MSKPFTVLIDLDSTAYDLLTPTLQWANLAHGLKLTAADIKEWHWNKPLGIDPYQFWGNGNVFYNLKPFPHCATALKKVKDWGVRQVFFSTLVDGPNVAWDKLRAIDRDFPFIGKREVLLTGGSKDLVNADMLIDDGPHNLEAFKSACGGQIVLADLCGAGYCSAYKGADVVMKDWKDYPEIVLKRMYEPPSFSEDYGR